MILVTGGTGFIGSHLLERLSASGVPARCLLRPTKKPRSLPPGVEPAFGDLTTGQGLEDALPGVVTVIHLAGVTKALTTAEFYSVNVRATEILARALAGRSVRLVHVSSLAAIGPSNDGTPVTEDEPPHPLTHYGKSKLEAERVVRNLAPEAVIVRPPVVYGPRDTDVFQLLKSISQGLVLEISGGDRWFSSIYVDDLVDGLLAAAQCPRAAGRAEYLDGTEFRRRQSHVLPSARAPRARAGGPRRWLRRGDVVPRYTQARRRHPRKNRRSPVPLVDLRHPARRRRTRFPGQDASRRGPRDHPGLVQGGGVAEMVVTLCHNTRLVTS
jgi:nucleoside-diphosphate-sugar epimerase